MSTKQSLSDTFEADQLQLNKPKFDKIDFDSAMLTIDDQPFKVLELPPILPSFSQDSENPLRGELADSLKDSMARLSRSSGSERIRGTNGFDMLYGDEGNDRILGLGGNDFLFGGTGDDTVNGGAGNDNLSGSDGNDVIIGGTGNDSMLGFTGNDKLLGGNGDDRLSGGDGNDFIRGGKGMDDMFGGLGNDTFMIDETGAGFATLFDFRDGQDKLGISSRTNVDDLQFLPDGNSTIIARVSSAIAVIFGVRSNQISAADFVQV